MRAATLPHAEWNETKLALTFVIPYTYNANR